MSRNVPKLFKLYQNSKNCLKILSKMYQNSVKELVSKCCKKFIKTVSKLCQKSVKIMWKMCQKCGDKTWPNLCQNLSKMWHVKTLGLNCIKLVLKLSQ